MIRIAMIRIQWSLYRNWPLWRRLHALPPSEAGDQCQAIILTTTINDILIVFEVIFTPFTLEDAIAACLCFICCRRRLSKFLWWITIRRNMIAYLGQFFPLKIIVAMSIRMCQFHRLINNQIKYQILGRGESWKPLLQEFSRTRNLAQRCRK